MFSELLTWYFVKGTMLYFGWVSQFTITQRDVKHQSEEKQTLDYYAEKVWRIIVIVN